MPSANAAFIIITLLIATAIIIIIERCSLLGGQPATCCLLVCHEACRPHQNQRWDLEFPTCFACTWWETLLFLSGYKALTNHIKGMGHKLWCYVFKILWEGKFEQDRDQKNGNCKLSVAFAGRSELPDKLTSKQANRLALSRVPHCVIIFFILSVTDRHPHLHWN